MHVIPHLFTVKTRSVVIWKSKARFLWWLHFKKWISSNTCSMPCKKRKWTMRTSARLVKRSHPILPMSACHLIQHSAGPRCYWFNFLYNSVGRPAVILYKQQRLCSPWNIATQPVCSEFVFKEAINGRLFFVQEMAFSWKTLIEFRSLIRCWVHDHNGGAGIVRKCIVALE
jgi:hypothetical protein